MTQEQVNLMIAVMDYAKTTNQDPREVYRQLSDCIEGNIDMCEPTDALENIEQVHMGDLVGENNFYEIQIDPKINEGNYYDTFNLFNNVYYIYDGEYSGGNKILCSPGNFYHYLDEIKRQGHKITSVQFYP